MIRMQKHFYFIFLLTVLQVGCGSTPKPNWKPAQTSHDVLNDNSLETLWSRENIYVEDLASVGLATSSDKVFILGSTDANETSKLNALDVHTGELMWKSENRPLFPIYADKNGVYVEEEGGGGNVTKYDPDTGQILWSRDFWDSSGVLHIIVYDGNLHVYLSPDKHKVLRMSDGKRIFSLLPKSPPFFDSGICGIAYQTPIHTTDTIYYRENVSPFKGEVCAVDISTGKLRWKSDLDVISNVAASDKAVFVLVESGEILALNPSNGKEIPNLLNFEK
jgi:outer membrane protein assembly factor BamB